MGKLREKKLRGSEPMLATEISFVTFLNSKGVVRIPKKDCTL